MIRKSLPWVKPLVLLIGISLIIFGLNRLVDYIFLINDITFLHEIYSDEVGNLTNPLGGLGEVVTAILGIEITVIAIVVQLAANKYSSKIMELFVQNRVNVIVMSLFVVTAINTILVTNTVSEDFVPLFSISFTLLMIIFSLLIVIPHFSYVFNFLRPTNFLGFVRNRTIKTIRNIAYGTSRLTAQVGSDIRENINFLGDVALNSVYQGDRAVTLYCVSMMREITVQYLRHKSKLPDKWFVLTGQEQHDPDFSSFSPFAMQKIEERRIIMESKIFKLYELLFDNSRSTLRDISTGVLQNSGIIARTAIAFNDRGAMFSSYQFFNTYLRIAIRGQDPRAFFTTLEHYRTVAEKLLDVDPAAVEQISFYFKYYGQEARKNNIMFALETLAHDLCRINELAYEKRVHNIKEILDIFLSLDDPFEETKEGQEPEEKSLIGVRIAQARLAGFYLLKGDEAFAKRIYEDMKIEPPERIAKIKGIIMNTKEEEFWEITPRGINFYYLSEERRRVLVDFFNWFDEG